MPSHCPRSNAISKTNCHANIHPRGCCSHMLDEALKGEIQAAYRRVLEAQGLTPRYGQRLMIAEIARTLAGIEADDAGKRLSDEHVCVLEEGTGTGKTLAYLLAALPVAKARGKRLGMPPATMP